MTDNIVTRAAPTVSGNLHLGSLFNFILNWLYARKRGGSFNVRLDGHLILSEQRKKDRDNILRDLDTFGLHYDHLIRQEDRLQEHTDTFKALVEANPEKFYQCDCTINDIAKRNLFGQNKMYRLLRPEKYPRPCRLTGVHVFDVNNEDVALNRKITASHESREHPVDVLTTGNGDYNNFWCNTDIGNSNSPQMTSLEIDLGDEKNICAIQLDFREYPFLDYQVFGFYRDGWRALARVNKPVEYCIEPRPSVPYPVTLVDGKPEGFKERINFPPVTTSKIKIDITRLPLPLDRPYHYDYFCKDKNKKIEWNKPETVVRCHYIPETFLGYRNFVTDQRIPHKAMEIDTAAWFDGKPDLVYSSPYDDKKMGATHLIRGADIYPFFFMEVMMTKILDYKPQLFFHGMIVDKKNVKYSKFIKSPAIVSYLSSSITPGKIFGYLAWKGGIVDSYPGEVTLEELIPSFDIFKVSRKDIVIDDQEMVSFLQ